MEYRLSRLDDPVNIAVSKPLLTEFGIHHRLESCAYTFHLPDVTSSIKAALLNFELIPLVREYTLMYV